MHSVAEAAVAWGGIMLPIAPVVLIGGVLGLALGILGVGYVLWVAPWQGLTYRVPPNLQGDDLKQLPQARVVSVHPSDRLGGTVVANGGEAPKLGPPVV